MSQVIKSRKTFVSGSVLCILILRYFCRIAAKKQTVFMCETAYIPVDETECEKSTHMIFCGIFRRGKSGFFFKEGAKSRVCGKPYAFGYKTMFIRCAA